MTMIVDHDGLGGRFQFFFKHNVNPTIHFCHIRYVCYEPNYLFVFVVKKDWTIM
jgi:hypothetical protein